MKAKFTKEDSLYPEAKKLALANKDLTIAKIQEKLKTGFARSSRLFEMLKKAGVIKEKSEKLPSFIRLAALYQDTDWGKFAYKPVIPIGMNTPINNLVANLENYFALFVAGKQGSGRETFLHCLMVNLLRNTQPEEFKFILIDTQKSTFKPYEKLRNLFFPLITDREEAKDAMDWCLAETKRRFRLSLHCVIGYIEDYNQTYPLNKMPRILVVINDYSDLAKKDLRYWKKSLWEMNRFGKFYGIHVLLSASKLTKDNFPARYYKSSYHLAFKTNSAQESELIIGAKGAEKLRGKGDALYEDIFEKSRIPVQSYFVSKEEIKKTIDQFG